MPSHNLVPGESRAAINVADANRIQPVMLIMGMLLLSLATIMLLPALIDLYDGNSDWADFAISAMITGFFGGALVMANRTYDPPGLSLRQAIMLTGTSWLILPAFACIPLLGIGLDFADAYFETVSGVTTTGSTVLVKLQELPRGQLLWRSLLQWLGGVGIVVMAIKIFPFIKSGAMQLFQSESSERGDHLLRLGAGAVVAWTMVIYSGLTFLCTLTFWAGGMSLFDAINHAMTTLSTGGYSTYDASFGAFQSSFLEWACVVFMMAGSIPFMVYVAALRGGLRQFWAFSQVRTFVMLVAVVSLCFAVWLTVNRAIPFLDALRLVAFNVTSVVTTTGFATTDYSLWGPTALGLFLCLTFVGGCSGSTAGGIKIFRLQILFMEVQRYLLRMASPHRVIELTYDGKPVAPDVPNAVLAFIAVFMATMGFFTAGLAAFGLDLVTAITGTATALCNVGPGLGEVIGPAGNFSSLPDGAKWLLSFAMLAGRLELFTLLVLLSPGFWRH